VPFYYDTNLANYYFGVYSLTYVTTNHGNEPTTKKLLAIQVIAIRRGRERRRKD
jgi:hypothetical protein